MLKTLTFVAAIAIAAAAAAQERTAGSLTDVTGTWVVNIESHQLGLELEQKDTKVEGVLHVMGQRTLLVGTFAEGKLLLKGERSEDQLPHAKDAGPITATMQEDGTLTGELSTNHGRSKWTGERLKKP